MGNLYKGPDRRSQRIRAFGSFPIVRFSNVVKLRPSSHWKMAFKPACIRSINLLKWPKRLAEGWDGAHQLPRIKSKRPERYRPWIIGPWSSLWFGPW